MVRRVSCAAGRIFSLTIVMAVMAFLPNAAKAQCYTFQAGTASLVLKITDLPTPTITSLNGTSYSYILSGLAGNSATLTLGGIVYTSTAPARFEIVATDSVVGPINNSNLQVTLLSLSPAFDATIGLFGGPANLFQNGLPAILPAISQWTTSGSFTAAVAGGGVGPASITAISSGCGSNATNTTNNKHSDFDGDGKADFAIWRPSNGGWFVLQSANLTAPLIEQWGLPGDVTVAGDYDGDGKTDYAIWRPAAGLWYVIPSSNPGAPLVEAWGTEGDVPVPGDYDGDGKTDFAVWRPSNGTWYVIPSGSPAAPMVKQWGLPGDTPVAGDFDGDGKIDWAVWRPSNGTWYIVPSTNPAIPIVKQWGLSGDTPVPGDYDGDGKTDFAVWRPSSGTWFVVPSGNVGAPTSRQWGLAGDVPVAADYDGDGKTDYAIWRPNTGTWWIVPSASPAAPLSRQWGLPGDVPE